VLVVVGIVLLLAGILVPILARSRVEGYRADATTRLRQIGLALEAYHQDAGGWPSRHLDDVVSANPQLRPLLLVKTDPYPKGYGRHVYDCAYGPGDPRSTELETSFEDVFATWDDGRRPYFDMLEPHDPNHGLVVLRVFGDRNAAPTSDPCTGAVTRFMGPLLRLRKDGSVQRAQYRDKDADGNDRVCYPGLFTDVDPDTVCERP
jgi:type II secretory pathway pseudopilin PulG